MGLREYADKITLFLQYLEQYTHMDVLVLGEQDVVNKVITEVENGEAESIEYAIIDSIYFNKLVLDEVFIGKDMSELGYPGETFIVVRVSEKKVETV